MKVINVNALKKSSKVLFLLVLAFVLELSISSFNNKISKRPVNPPTYLTQIISAGGTPETSEVEYIVKLSGLTIGSGTICSGQIISYTSSSDQCDFKIPGTSSYYSIYTSTTPNTAGCSNCSVWVNCPTPSNPNNNLTGTWVSGSTTPVTWRFN